MLKNNLEIIDATIEYIDQIMAVENLSFSIPWSQNSMMEEIANNKLALYILAKLEGNIVGYAGMWRICGEGHITNIAVHPEFRREGIGSALMSELISRCRKEGITDITLEVRKSNDAAIALYTKFGFRKCGYRKAYYPDNNEDAIIMWRKEE